MAVHRRWRDFGIVNGGSVTDGILSADTGPLTPSSFPAGIWCTYWDSAASFFPRRERRRPSTPSHSTSPAECSTDRRVQRHHDQRQHPAVALRRSCYASRSKDQVANVFAVQFVVSQSGTGPGVPAPTAPTGGVLGIFSTLFSNGNLGCSGSDAYGLDFVYGTGAQSGSNNYNLTPGTAGSAWDKAVTLADCGYDYPAVAGGTSGFGVLEDNENKTSVVYHAFDAAHQNFDTTPVTIYSGHGEQQGAISQDANGDIYATYLLGGGGGPLDLAYSPIEYQFNTHTGTYDLSVPASPAGGAWSSGALQSNSDGRISDATSAVGSDGKGWAVWIDNGSVFARQYDRADAINATPDSGPTLLRRRSTGSTVTLTISYSSSACTVTAITIEVSAWHPGPVRLTLAP